MRLYIIQVVLGLLILCVLFLSFDFRSFDYSKINFHSWNTLLIVIMLPVSLIIRSARWQILMNDKSATESSVTHRESFKYLMVGLALNLVLPAGTGDIAKSYFGYKWTGIKEKMFAVSLFDKLIGISSLAFLAIYLLYSDFDLIYIGVIVVSVLPVLILINYNRLIKFQVLKWLLEILDRKIKKFSFQDLAEQFTFSNKSIYISLALSVVGFLFTYCILFFCFRAFELGISLDTTIAKGPILTLGRLFPFTLNGLGSDEAIMMYVFSSTMEAQNDAGILLAAIFYRIVTILLPGLVGLYFLFTGKKR